MRMRFSWLAGSVLWSLASAAVLAQMPTTGVEAIRVPAGFTVEVAAGPPLVERPMLAAFDHHGRLYVADSSGVNLRGHELSKNPPHVIRVLEDTDGDGRFDTSRVFADKLVFPQGVVWHDGALYVSSPPSFWRLTDTDGDGAADRREELVTGFANTGVADDMHGGSVGPDGRIYWCAGRFPHRIQRPGGPIIHQGTAPLILRCRPDGSDVEVVCGAQGNAVGVAFLPEGDMFASGTFLAPNSMGAGLRDALIHCVDGGEYPVRDRVLNEHKRTGDLLPPLTHLGVAAASDLMVCRGNGCGEENRGQLFSALFNMHKIMRHKIERAGATFTCRNEDFLVSSDPDFHPTDVFQDADGSMLVIDTGGWFRIGCPTSNIAKPQVLGAIYRIRKSDSPAIDDPRGKKLDWAALRPEQLTSLLCDARFEVRDRAVEQLAKAGAVTIDPLVRSLASLSGAEAKCAAVWALSRIAEPRARAAVRDALRHRMAEVRQAAARAAGLHRDPEAIAGLSLLLSDSTPAVRREAATALGRIGDRQAAPALLAGLTSASDRFLEHSLIFSLIQLADREATLAGLAPTQPAAVKRGALIALDQMEGGGLTPEQVIPLLSPAEPPAQQAALWVIGRHGEWGREMVGYFGERLARTEFSDADRDELKRLLLAFARHPDVQVLFGAKLADSQISPAARLLLLEVMGQAPIVKLPQAWITPLVQSLRSADEAAARQAVATLRALPLDKRPVISRVDAQINHPAIAGPFAGTSLAENFCVRWTGLIHCPKDGTYTFYTESDDGSQLFIDGQLIVDNGGSHAMREKQGRIQLSAGDHELRVEYVQEGGDAGCIVSWSSDEQAKEPIPPQALFHAVAGAEKSPGLLAEFYLLGGRLERFPDQSAGFFNAPLAELALDSSRPLDLRVQAGAAVTRRLTALEPGLFTLLVDALADSNPPLVRLDAAEALAGAALNQPQLLQLAERLPVLGVLELPTLLPAFEHSTTPEVGRALVAALDRSPALQSIAGASLVTVLGKYPDEIRQQAQPLLEKLSVNRQQQQARLSELADVLTGGDIQRGRELFFANQKAICATCHAVQGQGGSIGPDLSKIGAIRAPADLLEAIVFPSASFARGYEPFTLATDDGQTHTGIIARETADAVYLYNSSRVEVRVPRAAIETLQQSSVSIMPEGMDKQLSRQELADLIAFLHSLR